MKKYLLSAIFSLAACMSAGAMSFSRAQEEALYLTDKMAYELNLNDQQYNDAYEINLDYFLRVDSPSDIYGSYYSYRLSDLRCILFDWQYNLLAAADYFLRPIVWHAGAWYFPIYSYYHRDHFYHSRPSVWRTYHGGHSRFHHRDGFYANRRPHHSSPSMGGHGAGLHRPGGSASHHSSPSGSVGRSHGNSFDGSSSRMHGGNRGSFGGSHHSSSPGMGSGSGFGGGSRSSSMSGGSRGGSFGGGSRSGSRGGGRR